MITHPAIAKVTFVADDATMEQQTENILFQARSWSSAMENIEDYYGKDLISVQIVMLDESPIHLSDKTFAEMADFQEITL